MRLQAFCQICDGENDLGRQRFASRRELFNAQGNSIDFKCKQCKEKSTIHLDDVQSAPGYGIYILVPVMIAALFPINHFLYELIPGPINIGLSLGVVFLASERFHAFEMSKSKRFNDEYIDPERKALQYAEKNKRYFK
mgnify:CR=1 FL=1